MTQANCTKQTQDLVRWWETKWLDLWGSLRFFWVVFFAGFWGTNVVRGYKLVMEQGAPHPTNKFESKFVKAGRHKMAWPLGAL